jgi:SAM-dependent methyltransferase
VAKKLLINPIGNHMPGKLLRGLLWLTSSELAKSNWDDPGGWRSMVISYDGSPERMIDRILVKSGAIPMAVRNRRKLAARLIAKLIDRVEQQPAHVLCLGAGPGHIIMDALGQAEHQAEATLVDISEDAFDYGRRLAERCGLRDRVRFIQGDVRDIKRMLDNRVDIVKMIGICEYLEDDQIVSIVKAVGGMMPPNASIVFNSLSNRHGTDAFFRRVFGLHMIHRSAEQLQSLMGQAGFCDFDSYAEPLMIYEVVVGKRGPGREDSPKGRE